MDNSATPAAAANAFAANSAFNANRKPFWASQTIWSSVAVIGSSVAGGVLAFRSGDINAFGAAVTAALGGLNAIVGRWKATSAID